MERSVIFIRHSVATISDTVEYDEWCLSPNGRALAEKLGEVLSSRDIESLCSSREKKAIQTAEIIGKVLHLRPEVADGIEEHHRRGSKPVGLEIFRESVKRFFENPDTLIFGRETARQSYERFSSAVDNILGKHNGNTAMVTHGTVLSLYYSNILNIDPYAFWRRLDSPCYFIFSVPGFELLESSLNDDLFRPKD